MLQNSLRNSLFHLIRHQLETDKIYLNDKDHVNQNINC